MTHNQQPYFQLGRAALGAYSTRILFGFLCSLSVLLLIIYLPVSTPPVTVGWSTHSSERIPLSEVQSEEEPESVSGAEENVPPSTRHASPQPAASSGTTASGSEDETADAEEDGSGDSMVRSITTLAVEDQKPEIVGGMGALYLQIHYPPKAQRQGVEGRLKLQFTVGREGDVRRIDVRTSLHPLCDSAAVQALRSVRFRPGTHEGDPVPVRMSLPVRFKLRSKPTTAQNNGFPRSGSP